MSDARELLRGFVDTHVHAGPALLPREFDSWELAQEALENDFAAVVIKDHHLPSMGLARIIQDHLPAGRVQVLGSLSLNNAVGGLNPKAVEAAIGFGARIIWLPTIAARNHQAKQESAGFPQPARPPRVPEEPIDCLEPDGRLNPKVEAILALLAEHPEAALATGHLGAAEVDAVVRRAFKLGLRRIVVTHPLFLVEAGLAEMKAWAGLGAYLEFTAINSFPQSRLYALPPARIAEAFQAVGPERIILSSDAGLKDNGRPLGNMTVFLELLLKEGVAGEDLRRSVTANPADLLGL